MLKFQKIKWIWALSRTNSNPNWSLRPLSRTRPLILRRSKWSKRFLKVRSKTTSMKTSTITAAGKIKIIILPNKMSYLKKRNSFKRILKEKLTLVRLIKSWCKSFTKSMETPCWFLTKTWIKSKLQGLILILFKEKYKNKLRRKKKRWNRWSSSRKKKSLKGAHSPLRYSQKRRIGKRSKETYPLS